MAIQTKIQWCDSTFNPWIGCTKVSPGCAHCYAETWGHRFGVPWGKGKPRRRTSAANWRQPLAWDRAADPGDYWEREHPWLDARPRVFCGSLCDWLDDEVPIEWMADLMGLIAATQFLDWQLLTKRPHNWRARLAAVTHLSPAGPGGLMAHFWLQGQSPRNVWIGTSAEDQARADKRIPQLLRIPAMVRFLSCEPMLGPIILGCFDGPKAFPIGRGLNWVICGGESGPGARPMKRAWARSLRDQCHSAEVPFFFKQWGDAPHTEKRRLLDGREWNEFPKA